MKKYLIISFVFLLNQGFSQVFISKFRVVSQDSLLNFSQKIILNYQQNHIAISFADKTDSSENFIYKLENLDKKWLKTEGNKSVTYANLFGGEYIFRVKNLQNKSETSLKFKVELAFWQNWWFAPMMGLYLILAVGLAVYFIMVYRFRQFKKLQKVRNDIAADLHDDVGATLSSIGMFGEMIRLKIQKNAPKEELLRIAEKVISTSQTTIQTMRGVVWTISPNNDAALDFFEKLKTFGEELLEAKQILLDFKVGGFKTQKLPLDIQRNLFLFYKEAINNIAKHSSASNTKVNLLLDNEVVILKINDNGQGFDINKESNGNGLSNLQKRADEIGGKLEISSKINIGTSIILSFHIT